MVLYTYLFFPEPEKCTQNSKNENGIRNRTETTTSFRIRLCAIIRNRRIGNHSFDSTTRFDSNRFSHPHCTPGYLSHTCTLLPSFLPPLSTCPAPAPSPPRPCRRRPLTCYLFSRICFPELLCISSSFVDINYRPQPLKPRCTLARPHTDCCCCCCVCQEDVVRYCDEE